MSLKTMVQDALTYIATEASTATVPVVFDGRSGTGVRAVVTDKANAQAMGEMGMGTNLVRVSTTEFPTPPTRGSTMLIDGEPVFVTVSRLDPLGAAIVIEYSEQQPGVSL